ncbi:hypothetical protein MCEMSE15_01834 [Fimbriimonadaceae bacterium]
MSYLGEDEDTRLFRNRIEVNAYLWLVASPICFIVCRTIGEFQEPFLKYAFNGAICLSVLAVCFAIATCRWRTVCWVLFLALVQYPIAFIVGSLIVCFGHGRCF